MSKKAGVSDPNNYYGFTSTFVDVDNDGRVDLLVANDSTPNYLYLNNGDGTFKDASFLSGFALNQDGRETAAMGLAVGDYRNDGLLALYTGTFSDDYKPLYRNEGKPISPRSARRWGSPNSPIRSSRGARRSRLRQRRVEGSARRQRPSLSAGRPISLGNFVGAASLPSPQPRQRHEFETVPAVEGSGLAIVIPGRGAGFGDLFNNGKIDVVINCMDREPVLLKNVNADKHHWVGLKLIGGPKSPRDAVGSAVYLTAGGLKQRADVMSGGSYESSNDQRPHFGIGDATSVDSLEIHWPDRVEEHVALPSVDRFYTIEEGKGIVEERLRAAGVLR